MTGETIECPNCGRRNPAWAQVCRTCGFALSRSGRRAPASTRFPTDQASLLSIGGAVGSIAIAIVLGLILSSMNPSSPDAAFATPTPSPTPTPTLLSTATPAPSLAPSAGASPAGTPKPIGTITFGTGLNATTKQVLNATKSFGPGSYFAHSVSVPQPFGVTILSEGVWRVANGKETVVQDPAAATSQIRVTSTARIFGFIVSTNSLLSEWNGGGTFVIRIYRGNEVIAQGQFTLAAS
jgi:hypothetical protein